MKTSIYSYVHLRARHDTNGNPRRLFLILKDGIHIDTLDEGYQGKGKLYSKYPEARSCFLTPIDVTPKEYKFWLKGDK